MNRKLLGCLVLAVGAFVAAGTFAFDDEELTGVRKERHDLMEGMAGAIQPIVAMVRGMEPYDADKMREMAEIIANSGGDSLTAVFPEGSWDPEGDALPAIWEQWDRFNELAHNLVDAANAMAAAAGNPPGPPSAAPPDPAAGGGGEPEAMDAGMALAQLGRSCGACHDDFRAEDDS